MREKGCCYGANPGHVRKSGAPPSTYSALFGINCAARAAAPSPAPVDGATTRETGFDHFKRFKEAGLTCWVFFEKGEAIVSVKFEF